MAVVQSTYAERISAAVAGMIANERNWDAETLTCETSAGIGFGLVVGNGSAVGGGVLSAATATVFRGISIRDVTLYPLASQTVDKYQQYDNMAVLTQGDIWVSVDGAVTRGNNVTYSTVTGRLGTTAADGTHILITNAQWVTTQATDAGLAIVRLAFGNAGT